MAEKRIKATNGKNKAKKSNDIISDDVIKMVHENHIKEKWEAEQRRKQEEKKRSRKEKLRRIERKENIIIILLFVIIFLIAGQFDYTALMLK